MQLSNNIFLKEIHKVVKIILREFPHRNKGCLRVSQESAQRERLLSTLQEDRERLQASHAVQMEKLRLQLDAQIQKSQLTHSRKVGQERE